MVRIPNVCSGDSNTVVLAHRNGGGMGRKHDDIFGAFACDPCHAAYDGRLKTEYGNATLMLWFYEGIFRTQEILLKEGLIKHG